MQLKVDVEISARHVHLRPEHLEILFGKNYQLTVLKDLRQPNYFAAEETVVCEFAPGNRLEGVRVIGPWREYTQVEISKTDAYRLKINPPVRCSGDLADSEKCRLIGPHGSLDLKEGVIVPLRHVHFDLETARNYGIKNGQLLTLKINVEHNLGVSYQVLARVSPEYALACHLDVDEGNAAGIKKIEKGLIIF
jgi:putative phosphotransacetylase